MPEPKVRFKRDDGSSYPAWKDYSISDLFTKIGNKNKDGQNTNVITNSAEFGLIPQRDYFDKDIAVEGNTGNYTIIQTGDFVYNPRKSSYAPMGPFNCYRLEEDGIVSPLYSCLRPKGVLNPEYLLWYFQTDKWYGYVNDHGAQNGARHDRVGMTDKILMGIPVTAPCEEEQRKIADFLSSVDEVITASEGEVANLETQKKAVMKKIFSQEVRFKRPDGTGFPEWEEIILTNILSEYKEMCEKDGTYEHVSLTKEGVVPKTERYERDFLVTTEDKKYRVTHLNDICYNPANLKFGVICRNKYKDAIFSPIYVTFTVNDKYAPEFIEMVVTNEAFIQRALKYQQGTVYERMAVSPADLLQMTVGIPCLEEQRLIADFLSDFDEAIAAAKKELELWKQLKKGLLQQMFV